MLINPQTDFTPKWRGTVGMYVTASKDRSQITVVNKAPQAKQVNTVTITTATDGETYSVVFNGVTVSYVAETSSSTTTIAAGLAAAFNATGNVRSQARATSSAAVITFTANNPGEAFTLTESSSKMTTASVTVAATASVVQMGAAIGYTGRNANSTGLFLGTTLSTALFSAQVDTYTVGFDDGVDWTIDILIEDVPYKATVTMATSATASATAMAARINALMPDVSVLASSASAVLTLTSELAGKPFYASSSFGPGVDTATMARTSTAGIATDAVKAFLGISGFDDQVERLEVASTKLEYKANSAFLVHKRNKGIYVATTDTPVMGGAVYVDLAPGASAGTFLSAGGSTTVKFPTSVMKWVDHNSTDAIGVIEIAA